MDFIGLRSLFAIAVSKFRANHWYLSGCLDPESDLISFETDYGYADFSTNVDLFREFSRQHEHDARTPCNFLDGVGNGANSRVGSTEGNQPF